MNARTAEQDDYTRLADLQDFVDVPEEGDTWVLMFPKEASVIRLSLMTLGEKSCWSYVGLLKY